MEFKEKFEISVRCPICGKYNSIFVEKEDYWSWMRNRCHIQDTFSYLTAPEREILISGICPSCWDKIFNEESYEEAV